MDYLTECRILTGQLKMPGSVRITQFSGPISRRNAYLLSGYPIDPLTTWPRGQAGQFKQVRIYAFAVAFHLPCRAVALAKVEAFSLCLWPIRRHLPHHEVCEENDERSVQRLARGPMRSQPRPSMRLAIDLQTPERNRPARPFERDQEAQELALQLIRRFA